MKIILARSAGFCYGVKRAIKLTKEALKNKPKPIQMIGDLVHNEFVVSSLKKQGLLVLNNLKDTKKGSFIIKSHGLPQNVIDRLSQKDNLTIIDTTCPNVKKAIKLAQFLEKEGYRVVIFGDKNHSEVKAISGSLKKKPIVIKNSKDFNKIKKKNKIGLISQTTQSDEEFCQIAIDFAKKIKDFKYFNTICPATQLRQKEANILAKKVDLILVIGSTKSANTKRLYQICQKQNKLTYLIQSDKFIKEKWLKNAKMVGLTAGASTPDFVIKNIIKKITTLTQ